MISPRTLTFALAGSLALLIPVVRPAANPDEEAIRRTIGYYFEGGKAGDSSIVRKAFHPVAMMFYVRDSLVQVPIFPEYLRRVAAPRSATSGPDQTERRIASIDITGTAAMAKLELASPTAVLTDYMSLLKINGEWTVVNKIFDRKMRAGGTR